MREDYNIGYERILAYFKECQGQTPRGVSLKQVKKGNGFYLSLQMKVGDKRIERTCDENMTMQGITSALEKASRVAEALKVVKSETEFLGWYEKNILCKQEVKNDLLTFGEAIKIVEENFWNSLDRKKKKRDRASVSHQASYRAVYGGFLKLLPPDKVVNVPDALQALDTKKKGSKGYEYCKFAFKKLAEATSHTPLSEALDAIKSEQTEFREAQVAELEAILKWFKLALEDVSERHCDSRQRWLWVFKMQMLYGFRIHEVFAIQNIDEPFKTKDGVTIPALCDRKNKLMVAVVGDATTIGTTTKTGYRLAAPMLPPSHPNLIEELGIRGGGLPSLVVETNNPHSIANKITKTARQKLLDWKCPVTQTHAFRHLCNQSGKQAGINIEDRAKNLGHSIAMNESVYLKREATNTRLASIKAMTTRQLPLDGAMAALKRIGGESPSLQAIALLSEIYSISIQEVMELLKD
jgi:hypothetical protein